MQEAVMFNYIEIKNLFDGGQYKEIQQGYQKNKHKKFDSPNSYILISISLHFLGEKEGAFEVLDLGLKFYPKSSEIYNQYAINYLNAGDLRRAEKFFKNSIFIRQSKDVFNNLAVCLSRQLKFDEAEKIYQRLIEKFGQSPDTLNGMSSIRVAQGRYSDALLYLYDSLSLDPKNVQTLAEISRTLTLMGDYENAQVYLQKAKDGGTKNPLIYFNSALLALRSKRFTEGFSGWDYKWGIPSERSKMPLVKCPHWNGSSCRSLYIWPEQGIGDHIMYFSLVKECSERCERIIFQTDERLIPLFQRTAPVNVEFIPVGKFRIPTTEFHIPMGSLPRFFRQKLSDFSASSCGFLAPNKFLQKKYESLLRDYRGKKYIGLSWRTASPVTGAKSRNISLKTLVDVAKKANIIFVNLQYGDTKDEIESLPEAFKEYLLNFESLDKWNDIDELAALICACHSVVTIDNVTLHLAGGLGKPTYGLLPFSADWRWGVREVDTYWYSSVKLIRQTTPQSWIDPLNHLTSILRP